MIQGDARYLIHGLMPLGSTDLERNWLMGGLCCRGLSQVSSGNVSVLWQLQRNLHSRQLGTTLQCQVMLPKKPPQTPS